MNRVAHSTPSPLPTQGRALVVHPDPNVRELLAMLLLRRGLATEGAGELEDALALACRFTPQKSGYDLLVTTYRCPERETLALQILRCDPNANISIDPANPSLLVDLPLSIEIFLDSVERLMAEPARRTTDLPRAA